jgi:multidrug efflux pump subunit AcrA (membrane-fusion protein)
MLERAPQMLARALDPRPLVRAGLGVIAATALAAGAWAALAPLSGAVIAPAFVKIDLNRKVVQHQEGGIVREILVRDGERVRQGQTLVVLDDVRVDATLDTLSTQLDRRAGEERPPRRRGGLCGAAVLPADIARRENELKVSETLERERACSRPAAPASRARWRCCGARSARSRSRPRR